MPNFWNQISSAHQNLNKKYLSLCNHMLIEFQKYPKKKRFRITFELTIGHIAYIHLKLVVAFLTLPTVNGF